ncbi:hypothetical protein AX17_001022 [Amanita inopinata Kibby_2008]|nr:hypothetical protein AX17_001022 [Amanita inopinata Kibby_2008]
MSSFCLSPDQMRNFPVLKSFLDLIRHGKNHLNNNNNNSPPPCQDHLKHDDVQPATIPSSHSTSRAVHQQAQATSSTAKRTAPMSPPTKEVTTTIFNEERETRNRMPSYKGLENFKLLEKMGDGAFSNVYKAIDITTGAKVAVKVVRKYELNASQRSNILKEVQIMRGTNHPSIVKLYCFSESPEHYFLVLELMEGGELFHQIVKLTYFSENLARHVILQVAQGIRYLHEERGVVHRDIKPENLLFERIPIMPSKAPLYRPYDEEKEDEGEFIPGVGGGGIGRVKIADFGLSKVVWNEQTMTPCGTVGYTAPEIVKDERYSKSVDMWALGCVLYTLLCGFPPFYDESISVLTEKVARGYYTFLSPWWDDINPLAKDLISHLLCVDPVQRYTIDEFLSHPWCNAAPAPPPTPLIHSYKAVLSGRPLDSPLLSAALGGRAQGRSPGLATLKEAFDITYAVHRMEEEGARRRKYRGNGVGMRKFLGGLNEDDEEGEGEASDEDNDSDASSSASAKVAHLTDNPVGAGGASHDPHEIPPRTRNTVGVRRRGSPKDFELDLDRATLLSRRHRLGAGVSTLSGKPSANSRLKLETLRVEDPRSENGDSHYQTGDLKRS